MKLVVIMRPTHTSASCPTCNTLSERVAVEYYEEGGYAAIRMTPCTNCGKLLCSSCDRANCDGCGEVFCADCLQHVEDGLKGLHCCQACIRAGEEIEQLPLLPELKPITAEVVFPNIPEWREVA